MTMKNRFISATALTCAALAASAMLPAAAIAAPKIVAVGTSYASTPFTFSFKGGTFTLTGTGDIFNPTAISTGGGGMVNTIFGQPTTYFTNRGTVTFGPGMNYGSFSDPTTIRFSNGENFIGLAATLAGETFYGFVYTTNNVVNSYGFEGVAGQAITATVNSAIPEPGTWALMIAGFGLTGAALRRRQKVRLALA